MAEVLGLAASVIAVVDMTGKVGSASFKLMRLWNEVNEVPDMLLQKTERIKDLEEFLDDTESQIAKNQLPEAVYNMARLQKHIAKARRALTGLQELIDRLQAKINADQRGFKRRFASTKVLIRKDEWNALDKSLDSALYLFSIAQTQYLVAMSTFCTTFVLEERPRSTKFIGQALIENDGSFEADEINSTRRRRRPNYAHSAVENVFHTPYSTSFLPTFQFGFGANSGFQLSIRTPAWLTGSVYSILAQRSFQGWQLNLRAYEVVEWFDDEVSGYLLADDALGLFRYLDEQNLTIHARDHMGSSMLWLAVFCNAFTTTRLLLERGLDSYVSDPMSTANGIPILFSLIPRINASGNSSRPQDLPFFELLADHGLDDVLDSTRTSQLLLRYGASYPAFRAFIKRNDFDYNSLPVEVRLQHLRELAESGTGYWSLDEILQILPEAEELTAEVIELSVEEDCALLHSFALLFSWRLILGPNQPGEKQTLEENNQWTKLISSCVRQDSTSLHHLELAESWHCGSSEASPFSCILWSFLGIKHYLKFDTTHTRRQAKRHVRRLVTALKSVLTAWIAILSDCDIDLLGYGHQERELHERGSTSYRRRWYINKFVGTARVSLIGITYGSRPEQWRLWWAWEYEDYAGEFWDLVESQAFKMPGSWVDEPWDCDDFRREEYSRLEMWEEEETTPLVWSEYRKVRPPI